MFMPSSVVPSEYSDRAGGVRGAVDLGLLRTPRMGRKSDDGVLTDLGVLTISEAGLLTDRGVLGVPKESPLDLPLRRTGVLGDASVGDTISDDGLLTDLGVLGVPKL